jgi:hypothetical protein
VVAERKYTANTHTHNEWKKVVEIKLKSLKAILNIKWNMYNMGLLFHVKYRERKNVETYFES